MIENTPDIWSQLNTGYLPQDYVSDNTWDILAFLGIIGMIVSVGYLIKVIIGKIVSKISGNG